jgi:hypothetical protein
MICSALPVPGNRQSRKCNVYSGLRGFSAYAIIPRPAVGLLEGLFSTIYTVYYRKKIASALECRSHFPSQEISLPGLDCFLLINLNFP